MMNRVRAAFRLPDTRVDSLLWPALLLSALLLSPPAISADDSIEAQRQMFIEARIALNQDRLDDFRRLRVALDDYPLAPYLDIWQAYREIDAGNDAAVLAVLVEHADVPEALELHVAWVESLAGRGEWPQVANHIGDFSGTAAILSEIAMLSRWYVGRQEEAMKQFSLRWQQGRKLTAMVEPLHKAWKKQGHPTLGERWGRIITLAGQGKWRQVDKLASALSRKHRGWLKQWRRVQNDPERALAKWPAGIDPRLARRMMSDGLNRLSRKNVLTAWELLHKLDSAVIDEDIGRRAFAAFERSIALRAARQHLLLAAGWLAGLPAAKQNEETRAWLVRLNLLYHDWQGALAVMETMPAGEARKGQWLYWRAKALEEVGRAKEAAPLYAELATERGYYSFLSAERLGLPPRFDMTPIEAPEDIVQAVAGEPAVRRAFEWLRLDETGKAIREWNRSFAGASEERWRAAAAIASSWGWHDRVIQAAYRAGEQDALHDRFPTGFEPAVMAAAERTGLPPELIWSIIRQESAFNRRALSSAGARGLMQLMPRTARDMAREHGVELGDLFSPEKNIELGSLYLAEMLERFDGNSALAAAAYNAGPRRVGEWLERTPFESPEAWIEAIPFNETRRYVQQVMAFVAVYEWRQAKQISSVSGRINSSAEKVDVSLKE